MQPLRTGACIYPQYHQYRFLVPIYRLIYTYDNWLAVGQRFGIDIGEGPYICLRYMFSRDSISNITLY